MDYAKSGDLIGQRFRVIHLIGVGFFAQVFVAHDLHSGQTVAIKMLRPERFGDANAVRRFERRELRLLERIEAAGHSPHIVRLVENGLHDHRLRDVWRSKWLVICPWQKRVWRTRPLYWRGCMN